ncbi:MAG: response regulator [Magnetospirillum sp.]|nr:response regulator [Magnetospirillum sp.]
MTVSSSKARTQVFIPLAVVNVSILLGVVLWLVGEYSNHTNTAQATLSSLTRATLLTVTQTFDQTRQNLLRDEAQIRRQGVETPRLSAATIDSTLHQHAPHDASVIDVTGRDYARALSRLEEGEAFPGLPMADPGNGSMWWPVALRTGDQSGALGLVTKLSVDQVLKPLENIRIKPDGLIWLVRDDGTILASAPWRADLIGQSLDTAAPGLSRRGSVERMVGTRVDNTGYLAVTASVPDHPLRLVVATPDDVFLVDWWREAGMMAVLLAVMMATSVFTALRQMQLQERLESLNARLRDEVVNQSAALETEIRERQGQERLARMLRNALEHSGTMMLITDSNGTIEYANPSFYKATGYTPDDIVGQKPSLLRHRELSPPASTLWPTILDGQTWTGMFCNRCKDGSALWVSATISPVVDALGVATHYVAVEEDATSRRVGEEELMQAKQAAEAANLAKSEFLSSMSHELRTPMNAILGFAQLLASAEDGELGERQRFYADSILKSGNHLISLVNDILDIARIEAGRLSLSFEPVSLERILAEIKPMIAPMAERRKVTLADEISGKSPPILEADFIRLKQVLINLISNAVKYNRSGGSVRLTFSHGDTGPVRVSVSDTGIGISEKRKAEVFLPFSRLGAEASSVEGTGIGLTISKMLVESMGGQIGFFSQENLGTTFWLEIPRSAQQGQVAAIRESQGEESTSCLCQMTLLYIEDNPSNVELMQEIIDQDPHCRCHLLVAGNAEEGLAMAREHRPGLVIMDINLPGMNGIEAVAHMKADPDLRSIPVIALSADVMPDTIRSGMKAGFVRYLRKPLDIGEFRKILNQLGRVAS